MGDVSAAAPIASAVLEICGAVGLELRGDVADVPARGRGARLPSATRLAPRKDCARADAIRDELQADGWVVEDTAGGTLVRRP